MSNHLTPAARTNPSGLSASGPAAAGVSPADLLDVADFERAAKLAMPPMVWEYVSGGVADEVSLRWNRESFDRIKLRPRVLVDVSKIDTRVRLLDEELAHPILLAPTAYQRLSHPDGEMATVAGAGAAEALMVLSTFSTVTLEEVAAKAARPLWFQLYMQRDRDFTGKLVQRAEAAGYRALVVTVDTPVLGPRYRELRAKFTLPPGLERANLRGLLAASGAHRPTEESIFSATLNPALTWKDLEWLRSFTTLPILLKGIIDPDDATLAVEAGVAGIIVSNHGARNLDTGPATLDALPGVVERVAGRMPVLVDGGVRRGTDILKAIGLGATAVLVGRPYVYGLAVDGARGVTRITTILRRELEMAMAMCGKISLGAVDASVIWK